MCLLSCSEGRCSYFKEEHGQVTREVLIDSVGGTENR